MVTEGTVRRSSTRSDTFQSSLECALTCLECATSTIALYMRACRCFTQWLSKKRRMLDEISTQILLPKFGLNLVEFPDLRNSSVGGSGFLAAFPRLEAPHADTRCRVWACSDTKTLGPRAVVREPATCSYSARSPVQVLSLPAPVSRPSAPQAPHGFTRTASPAGRTAGGQQTCWPG